MRFTFAVNCGVREFSRRSTGFLVCLLVLIAASVGAAEFRVFFHRLSTDDGLLSDAVFAVAQDRHGFLWFGTEEGLARWDGIRFENLRHRPNDPQALADEDISDLLVDREGSIWIATWGGGLDRLDARSGRIRHFRADAADPNMLPDNRVQVLRQGSDGAIWVGLFSGGLCRLDPETWEIRRYSHDPDDPSSIGGDRVWSIAEGADGQLFVGTENGLDRLDLATSALARNILVDDEPRVVRTLLPAEDGSLWVGRKDGLWRFDPMNGAVDNGPNGITLAVAGLNINTMLDDGFGGLWVGTIEQGLFRLDLSADEVDHFAAQRRIPHRLGHADIRDLVLDRSRVLWVATRGGGVSRIDLKTMRFSVVRGNPDDPRSLADAQVSEIHVDSAGTLRVGTSAGLDEWDENADRFVRHRHDPGRRDSLGPGPVLAITEDAAGLIWVGTWGGGLSLEVGNDRYRHFVSLPDDDSSLANNVVTSLCPLPDGRLWVGTVGGLHLFDPASRSCIRYLSETSDGSSPSDDFIRTLLLDRSGNLWIGTDSGGLERLDASRSRFTNYRYDSENDTTLSSNRVTSLHQARDGRIWIGSSNGLNRIDETTGHFDRFGEQVGLPTAHIQGMLDDDDGRLWISTTRGLYRFDPESGDLRSYVPEDGLQGIAFRQEAVASGPDGEFFFGGNNGLNRFFPDRIRDNEHQPPIVLTKFRRFDQTVDFGRPTSEVEAIELSWRDNFFSFEFAALDFTDPARNRFRYLLEGFDPQWVEAGSENRAVYTNVPPGHYQFRAQGANSDGIWNREGLVVDVAITPPYWATPRFRIGAGVLVVLLFVGFHRLRIRSIARRNLRLETLVREKTTELEATLKDLQAINEKKNQALEALQFRTDELEEANIRVREADRAKSLFLANMSHEFRTPLNSIIGFSDVLIPKLEGTIDPTLSKFQKNILRSGRHLLGLIDDILDLSKIEAGKMELQLAPTSVADVVENVCTMMAGIADKMGVRLVSEVSSDLPEITVDEDRVRQILYNLISNAVKFSEHGDAVTITGRALGADEGPLRAAGVEIAVRDEGIGIKAEDQQGVFQEFQQVDDGIARAHGGTGLGLALVRRFAEMHGGVVTLDSTWGQGSTFRVLLPLEPPERTR